jgi:competence protein ComEA
MMHPVLQRIVPGLALWACAAAAQKLPDNPGRELFETICTECHTTDRVVGQQKTRAEWQLKVTEMLQEDQDVTQAERDTIVNYLAASFPKPGKVNVNKAAGKQLETILDLTARDAEAIVRYRQEKGAFKTLDDLKKVPGVDAAKIEASKDHVEFQ